MKLFLTSDIGGWKWRRGRMWACALKQENGLVKRLEACWPNRARCLMLSSDPDRFQSNDQHRAMFRRAFALSGLLMEKMDVCDSRTEYLAERLNDYNVLLIVGGHVPTQNRFFEKLQLRERLQGFEGIAIGISAGTMNSADVVYAAPELEGEAVNPQYQRYLRGLGLTWVNVLPHFQAMVGGELDGLRLFEDVFLADSWQRPFFALPDGSYIVVDERETILYGEGYWLESGKIEQICENGRALKL